LCNLNLNTMKRIFVIFSSFATTSCLAQTACSRNAPLFSFDNANVGNGKEVTTLGSNPEFPFLRNMSSSEQVYTAIKNNSKRNGPQADAFNNLMMEVGFANGSKDVTASSITEDRIPYGTEGNMGSGSNGYTYCKLDTDPGGTRAWKISSGGDCYTYILAKCGNAFYPHGGAKKTACLDVPVSVASDPKEVTLESAPPVTTTDKVYVYYHRKKHSKRHLAPEFADIPDPNASNPVLLSLTKNVETVPQSYKVTVNVPEDHIMVCPDTMLSVPANISVEKVSEFTGYNPATAKKNYKEVSRRTYRKIARKMRKAERKENRVARLSGVPVDVPEKG
jgi:hypothetical protein